MTKTDRAIAYSRHSSVQVYVRTIALSEMMTSKIDAFLQRKEIRDAYDLEFLVRSGDPAVIHRPAACGWEVYFACRFGVNCTCCRHITTKSDDMVNI